MKNIVIYPNNKSQLFEIQSFLEKMNIKFRFMEKKGELTDWQKQLVEAGLQDIEAGRVVPNNQVSKKAKAICLK